MEQMTAISDFLLDIECMEPISRSLGKVNVFDVLGLSRTEIRHSNMLAWLMDPNGNHGLGDSVLRGIICSVTDETPENYTGFTIRRETNNIDLLAVSEAEKYVVCIENKIDSGEHDNQLARYKKYVDHTFPDYRHVLIYLTPKGTASSDPEHWRAMSYADILRIIQDARDAVTLQPETELLLSNYLEVIGKFSGGSETVKKECEKIYLKHQKALDLIFKYNEADPADDAGQDPALNDEKRICEGIYRKYRKELDLINKHKPGKGKTDLIASMIRSWAVQKSEEDIITFCPEKSSDKMFRFKTKAMSEILPDIAGRQSAWNTENFYFYEIRNTTLKTGEHEVFLQMAVASKNMPEDLRRVCDRINEISPSEKKKEDWAYRLHFTTKNHIFLTEKTDENTIYHQLDAFLDEVFAFERMIVKGLVG